MSDCKTTNSEKQCRKPDGQTGFQFDECYSLHIALMLQSAAIQWSGGFRRCLSHMLHVHHDEFTVVWVH